MLNFLFLKKLFLALVAIIFYYFIFKFILKNTIRKFRFFKNTKCRFSKNDYFGAYEMVFLSISHLIFCLCIVVIFNNNIEKLFAIDFLLLTYSIVLGISLFV